LKIDKGEDLLKCYEIVSPTSRQTPAGEESSIEKNNTEFEVIVARYFTSLARLVQHHICTYPRISIKGQTSPRSCFSGVLTSLLFGSRSATAGATSSSSNFNDKFKSSYDSQSQPQFSPFGGQSQSSQAGGGGGGAGFYAGSNQSSFGLGAGSNSGFSGVKQRSLLSTTQSVLCNRDILVCLLLKFGINLLTDVRINFSSILSLQPDQLQSGGDAAGESLSSNKVTF
jgi:hypothetical protein